jgi:hypothetical protein
LCFVFPVALTLEHRASVLFHFSFLILRQSVRLLGRAISHSQGHNLHRTTQTQNERRQISMPSVGIESTTPVFERAKTVHALDGEATVIGMFICQYHYILYSILLKFPLIYYIHFIPFANNYLSNGYWRLFSQG